MVRWGGCEGGWRCGMGALRESGGFLQWGFRRFRVRFEGV